METQSKLTRQLLGCGYEPKYDGKLHLTVWQPPSPNDGKPGYDGPQLKTCAGYTVNLPEVNEAYFARAHWARGNVAFDRTPRSLLEAILIVDGQHTMAEAWARAEKT